MATFRKSQISRFMQSVWWLGIAAATLTVDPAAAVPLKTDAGNPIANWVQFSGGVPGAGLGPGMAKEDGSGPPPKVTQYVEVADPNAAAKAAIIAADRAAHPSIPPAGSSDPTWQYDCHGYTFKAGALWIDNDQVDRILVDQGWSKRGAGGVAAAAVVGDIVIYRDAAGKVTHSGIVTQVDAQGKVTSVHSKWGARGDYEHAPNDVPASYGSFEVRTGGKPLKDPALAEEDVNVFQGHVPPPLKAQLSDFFTASDAPTAFNDFPIPDLHELSHGPTTWDYGLDIPQLGLSIAPGDTLTLFGDRWISAAISGLASLASFGAWEVRSVLSDSIVFDATASAFVPGDFSGLITGFAGISLPSVVGEIVYTEAIAGSIGLVSGPVPEPSTVALLMLGLLTLARLRKPLPRRVTRPWDSAGTMGS